MLKQQINTTDNSDLTPQKVSNDVAHSRWVENITQYDEVFVCERDLRQQQRQGLDDLFDC